MTQITIEVDDLIDQMPDDGFYDIIVSVRRCSDGTLIFLPEQKVRRSNISDPPPGVYGFNEIGRK